MYNLYSVIAITFLIAIVSLILTISPEIFIKNEGLKSSKVKFGDIMPIEDGVYDIGKNNKMINGMFLNDLHVQKSPGNAIVSTAQLKAANLGTGKSAIVLEDSIIYQHETFGPSILKIDPSNKPSGTTVSIKEISNMLQKDADDLTISDWVDYTGIPTVTLFNEADATEIIRLGSTTAQFQQLTITDKLTIGTSPTNYSFPTTAGIGDDNRILQFNFSNKTLEFVDLGSNSGVGDVIANSNLVPNKIIVGNGTKEVKSTNISITTTADQNGNRTHVISDTDTSLTNTIQFNNNVTFSGSLEIGSTGPIDTVATDFANDSDTSIPTTRAVENRLADLTTTDIAEGPTLRYLTQENFDTHINITGANVDLDPLTLDSTNSRVGIGTDTPEAQLHIFKDDDTNNNLVEMLRLERYCNDLSTSTNAEGGYISLHVNDDSDDDIGEIARISWRGDNVDNGEDSGRLGFWTTKDDTITEKLTITRDGNVGIGTINPASILHIYQDKSNAGATAGLTIEQDGSGDAICQYLLTNVRRWVTGIDHSDGDKFKISSSADLHNDARLTIDTSGDVGIGTSGPLCRLQVVSENAHVSGSIFGNTSRASLIMVMTMIVLNGHLFVIIVLML
jgi:hypothetical protein